MMPLMMATVALDGLGQATHACLQISGAFARGTARSAKNAVRAMICCGR